jgi:molybdenum cofactor cytidylyltransferase
MIYTGCAAAKLTRIAIPKIQGKPSLISVPQNKDTSFAGILLAAGKGSRFDPTGVQNKLMQPLANGDLVVVAAAKNLLSALPMVLAVVRPDAEVVAAQLRALGCKVTECPRAEEGMGASLVHALSQTADAAGWVIALADMPYVQPNSIKALIDTIMRGADIAAPTFSGSRGNPIAFSRKHLPDLLRLSGDEGARTLLKIFPVTAVAVEDAGIALDIDTPRDLHR